MKYLIMNFSEISTFKTKYFNMKILRSNDEMEKGISVQINFNELQELYLKRKYNEKQIR